MKSDSMLELRVLTGTHAGARALLSAEPQWIGCGDECALILTDEGLLAQHACIEHCPDGTLTLRWQDEREPPVVLRPGESAWIGPVRIAVETLGMPWREDLPVATPSLPPALEVEPQHTELPKPAHAGKRRKMLIAVAVLALAFAALIGGWFLIRPARVTQAPPARPAVARIPDEPLPQLIARLGLKGRVTLDLSDSQHPSVKAVFLSAQEAESLTHALSQRAPSPHLVLVDEAQAVNQVTQAVQRMGKIWGVTLTTHHLGDGKFRVEGQVADATQRSQIAADLKDSLPQVMDFEFAMQVRTDAARAMVEALKRQGVAQLQAQWTEGLLTMQVRLPPGGLPKWEQALLAIAAKHDVPFRALVQGQEAAADSASTPPPFTVRSVMTSPQPYVVLADGRKLAPGGDISGWRLVVVDRQAVRFEGPHGQTLTVER